jgi:Undecaprenyl-phosphate glucose phosphotransferase
VLTFARVYEARRTLSQVREIQLLLQGHCAALLLFIAVTYFFEDYRYSRLVMVYFALLAGASMVATRLVTRALLRHLRARGFNLRRVLAVGEGEVLEGLIERLGRFPELGLSVSGVVTREGSRADSVCGKPVVGHFAEISQLIASQRVDEVLIALPPWQSHEMERLLELLKDETLDVRIVPDVHRYVTLGCDVEDFDGLPVVRINDSPLVGWSAAAKRATDAVLSAIALVVLAPLFALIAIAIKLSSRGPILYAQERMGLDGRKFEMLKFRSMKVDAESLSGAVWARAEDSRRTAIGTLLRKTSLDELPQFWNVLRGEMSLVGPRPERPVFVAKFRREIPHYMLRHKVRSGITGWAQVNGWRGNTSLDRRIECDLFYIRNWSYTLDLKILTMTLWRGFIHKNAY